MIKVLELFGGIGACTEALKRLNIDFKVVDYVEIDKYAVKSYNAINNTDYKPQDVKTWDKNIECDLIMHGSPCQDFSLLGAQAGGDKGSGTRSSLMYETIRIALKLKPKYIIWENVKNVISKKHIHNFNNYIQALNEGGYNSYAQVLNAKDYGVPQNRERVFVVSIRKELNQSFRYPQKQPLNKKLSDLLESNVDKKYYLTDKMKATITKEGGNWQISQNKYLINRDIARTIGTRQGHTRCDTSEYICKELPNNTNILKIINNTKQGYLIAQTGDGINISSRMKYQRGNVQKQMCGTIDHQGGNNKGVVLSDLSIRRLTPKECWRAMDFTDYAYEKASKVCSDTQLCRQAGNTIVVNVLVWILKNLLR